MTGYLPSAVLKGFIYIVPFAMFAMAKIAGCIARSKEEIKACNMVFYFLVGNVFLLSVLSGSLLDLIGQFISHPKNIPSNLATAVSAQVCCFHFMLPSIFFLICMADPRVRILKALQKEIFTISFIKQNRPHMLAKRLIKFSHLK